MEVTNVTMVVWIPFRPSVRWEVWIISHALPAGPVTITTESPRWPWQRAENVSPAVHIKPPCLRETSRQRIQSDGLPLTVLQQSGCNDVVLKVLECIGSWLGHLQSYFLFVKFSHFSQFVTLSLTAMQNFSQFVLILSQSCPMDTCYLQPHMWLLGP